MNRAESFQAQLVRAGFADSARAAQLFADPIFPSLLRNGYLHN
ncbi:hypothetical protein [Arcanobacterium hippocoleae]